MQVHIAEILMDANGPGTPGAVMFDAASGQWLLFSHPEQVLTAARPEDVLPLLQTVEQAVEGQQRHAAGFVAYEAAPGCDPCLTVKPDRGFPLAWFGLFAEPLAVTLPDMTATDLPDLDWRPSIGPDDYGRAIQRIKAYLHQGETYQVNFTYRLRSADEMDPWTLFLGLLGGQPPPYAAYVDTGEWVVLSASPELFFRVQGEDIVSRPMKGTAPRGLWTKDDRAKARALRDSPKERAENVMIVDMVRHDLGRIAKVGSVEVPELFGVEQYPTLWQMTSTVAARTRAGLSGIFQALFPPASITGAPKARTMAVIAELEDSPRRVYTGSMGFAAPGRRAQFNVAIRTVLLDRRIGAWEYGVGGGVVWDSVAEREHAETRLKARVLFSRQPRFDLLETLLWTPEQGWMLLNYHLSRLTGSAGYFGFVHDENQARRALAAHAASLEQKPHRVRLLLNRRGHCHLESTRLLGEWDRFPDIRLASRPVDRNDPFLYHKTTNRRVYQEALQDCPGCADLLLFNQDGEITESTLANVAFELRGTLCTPPVSCGLLPGTCRAWLLDMGFLTERVVTVEEARAADTVYLMNGVRGLQPVKILVD